MIDTLPAQTPIRLLQATSPTMIEQPKQMSESAYVRLRELVYNEAGIKLPPAKRTLLEARLQSRLRALNMAGFEQYCRYLFAENGMLVELPLLLDAISTNKTSFFREPLHFDWLRQVWLPQITAGRHVRVWSAGCSTGEEPYSLAMLLANHAEKVPFQFSIFASDISTEVLKTAVAGVYPETRMAEIPMDVRRKYVLRSRDPKSDATRVAPEIRARIHWQRLNLMSDVYATPETYDLVFCRNVIIYFDRDTQEAVIRKLCTRLHTGGYLFLGHSESIQQMQVPLQQMRPTIFCHTA